MECHGFLVTYVSCGRGEKKIDEKNKYRLWIFKEIVISASGWDNLDFASLVSVISLAYRITANPRHILHFASLHVGHVLSSNELQDIKRTPRVNSRVLSISAIRSNPYLFDSCLRTVEPHKH